MPNIQTWISPNILKEEEEKEEEMEIKRRDEEEVQDTLVVEEVMMVNFPLVPFPLSPSLAAPAPWLFLPIRSLKNKHCRYAQGTYIMHHML